MKEIKLTQGKIALVDDEDFEYLNQFKWYILKGKYTNYVCMVENNKTILMHRIIMNTPINMEVDHIDHNGLNCQRYNMRICTHSQNSANRGSRKSRSKYRGVSFLKQVYKNKVRTYIVADIRKNNKTIHLGYFKTEEDAALAYNKAAIYYHKEFANINIIN